MRDLISRQDAIDALDKRFDNVPMEQTTEILLLRKDLREMSSASLNYSEIPNNSDTISRQDAKDVVDMELDAIDHVPEWVYDRLLTALDKVPSAQPEQHWIPIGKKTNPTKSGWYLVTVHEDATIDNERFTGIAEFDATNGVWYDIDEPTDMYLRWMPLPEPWKGAGDEND